MNLKTLPHRNKSYCYKFTLNIYLNLLFYLLILYLPTCQEFVWDDPWSDKCVCAKTVVWQSILPAHPSGETLVSTQVVVSWLWTCWLIMNLFFCLTAIRWDSASGGWPQDPVALDPVRLPQGRRARLRQRKAVQRPHAERKNKKPMSFFILPFFGHFIWFTLNSRSHDRYLMRWFDSCNYGCQLITI